MPYIVFSIRIVTVLYELFENIWKAEVEYYKEKIYLATFLLKQKSIKKSSFRILLRIVLLKLCTNNPILPKDKLV